MNDYTQVADPGLQQERTALAWERTALSMMVAGILLSRYAAEASRPLLTGFGLLQTLTGAGVLVWAGLHYLDLHDPIRGGDAVVHPLAARIIGLSTVGFTAAAVILVVADLLTA